MRARTTKIVGLATLLALLAPTQLSAAPAPDHVQANSPIITGPSRAECLEPDVPGTPNATSLAAAVNSFDALTHSDVTCVIAYLNGAPTWSQWTSPWVTAPQYGYTAWAADAPGRQLVLQVDLIPNSLEDIANPTAWEQTCANGDFTSYATSLGNALVASGLANSVLRLGAEANGPWEVDYIGTTPTEQHLWAQCFDAEVAGLRAAPGEHFLIDWNPNACTRPVPYANYYPGNAYVDLIGLDLYDVDCQVPKTPADFTTLAQERYGLNYFESFARTHQKPMSFPEWGLAQVPSGDDPAYIDGLARVVASRDVAFEAYFDAGAGDSLPLTSSTPRALSQFQKWFGTS